PDITLVGAVEVDGAVGGYGVVRAHHSDVGGMQAGSMPAGAREIFAEGVVVPPLRLTPDVDRFLLANVRTPEARRADLAAQRAAVERGADGLRALAARHGWAALREAARDLQAYAERRAREALGRLAATGLTAPEGCMVHARFPSAVAAGNVETSQRIVDTVFLALARGGVPVPAQGQGTMNNVSFGGTRDEGPGTGGWTYYETIGGGQGASHGAPGPSGVHVGMSNTRNTPIEVLEMEYPLRLKAYALRRGSGGVGKWSGGEGVIREFEALAAMDASVLSDRRRHAPCGAGGGGAGAPGRTLVNGAPLPPKASTRLTAGDVVRVETPGGGGWGQPEPGGQR